MMLAHVEAKHVLCRKCHWMMNYASSTGPCVGTAELFIMQIC